MSACVVPIPTTTAPTTDDHRRPQTIDDTYLTAQVPAFDLHAADFDFPHGKPHRRHRMSMQRRPGEGVDETGLPGVLQTHDRYFQLLAEEPAAQPCDEPRPQRGTGGRRHWIGSRSSSSECEFVSSGSVVRVLACLLACFRETRDERRARDWWGVGNNDRVFFNVTERNFQQPYQARATTTYLPRASPLLPPSSPLPLHLSLSLSCDTRPSRIQGARRAYPRRASSAPE